MTSRVVLDEPDHEGAVGELEREPPLRHRLHPRPDQRHRLPEPEEPEVEPQSHEIITDGYNSNLGYYKDNPKLRCEPIDIIGEDSPEGMAFCQALGCVYSPPRPLNANKLQS